MDTKIQITKEGLVDLKKELEDRLTKIREKIADEIETAREQGDLSENAAYKAAMDEKEFNEKKIVELDDMIKNAVIIVENKNSSNASIGKTVVVLNKTTNSKSTFELVGPSEADPTNGKISVEAPLGMAIVGKKKDQVFQFATPAGENEYVIVDIK